MIRSLVIIFLLLCSNCYAEYQPEYVAGWDSCDSETDPNCTACNSSKVWNGLYWTGSYTITASTDEFESCTGEEMSMRHAIMFYNEILSTYGEGNDLLLVSYVNQDVCFSGVDYSAPMNCLREQNKTECKFINRFNWGVLADCPANEERLQEIEEENQDDPNEPDDSSDSLQCEDYTATIADHSYGKLLDCFIQRMKTTSIMGGLASYSTIQSSGSGVYSFDAGDYGEQEIDYTDIKAELSILGSVFIIVALWFGSRITLRSNSDE